MVFNFYDFFDSFCIGVCLMFFDEVCKGCGCMVVEVLNWVFLSDDEKCVVWECIMCEGIVMCF